MPKIPQRILFLHQVRITTTDLFDVVAPTAENIPLCIGDVTTLVGHMLQQNNNGELVSRLFSHHCQIKYHRLNGVCHVTHIWVLFVDTSPSPFKIYGHDQTRAFCYIDDAVTGMVVMESANKYIIISRFS